MKIKLPKLGGPSREKVLEAKFKKAGYFAEIRWTGAAHTLGVDNKKIYMMYHGRVVDEYPYTRAKIEELQDMEIVVVDGTGGAHLPPEYVRPPPSEIIQGRLKLGWI